MKYTKIKRNFVIELKNDGLSEDTILLWTYILTTDNMKSTGIFRLPKGYICADLEWDTERLLKAFNKLMNKGYIRYDETRNIIWVKKWIKYNIPDNENQKKNRVNNLDMLDETPLLIDYYNYIMEFGEKVKSKFDTVLEHLKERLSKSFYKDTNKGLDKGFSKPSDKPSVTKDKDTDKDKDKEALVDKSTWPVLSKLKRKNNLRQYPDQFEKLWDKYPKRNGSNPKGGCYKKVRARIKEGVGFELLLQSTKNYKSECKDKDKINTEFIQQAKTFFGSSDAWQEYIDKNFDDSKSGNNWETCDDLPKDHPLYGTKFVN